MEELGGNTIVFILAPGDYAEVVDLLAQLQGRTTHAELWRALLARDPVTRVVRMPRAHARDFYHLLRDHADATRASSGVLERARAIVFDRVTRILGRALGLSLPEGPESEA
jgi:hypothetical protein